MALPILPVKIYGLIDPRDQQLKYIGKTVKPLWYRLSNHVTNAVKATHKNKSKAWLCQLYNLKLRPEIFLIDEVSLEEWQFWEAFYIEYFKGLGCKLKNLAAGGQGPTKIARTKEQIESARQKMLGRPGGMKGKKHRPETITKKQQWAKENPDHFKKASDKAHLNKNRKYGKQKLTKEDAATIRAICIDRSKIDEVAISYKVSVETVRDIVIYNRRHKII